MKKVLAWMLALCMLLSTAAAETQVGTEKLLEQMFEIVKYIGTFWLDYADDRTQLMGGLVLDENDLPGAGARFRNDQTDVYAALDAQGVRFSDGQESLNATWEELTGLSGMAASAAPQLTEADGELVGMVLGEMLMPVMQTAQVTESAAQLNGQPAQSMEIQLPLRAMCAALDESVPAALSKYRTQIDALLARNADFLASAGVQNASVDAMLHGWQQLGVSQLITEDVTVLFRWTQSSSEWKLEASLAGVGLELNGSGEHVDGRVYVGQQEWAFDTRDLQAVLDWAQELLLRISPDALDFSFGQKRGETHLHVKADVAKLTTQLTSGVKAVLDRHSAQAQAILDRYAPYAQLFGAEVPAGLSIEAFSQQLQTAISRALFQLRTRSSMYGPANPVLELDFYTARETFSLYLKSPLANADVSVDADGMDLDASVLISRHWYDVAAHGLWNTDGLQLNGTLGTDGAVSTRWTLSGVVENGARILTLNANNAWIGTATLREGSIDLTAASGLQGSLLWGRSSASLHAVYGEESVDFSFRRTGSQLTASFASSPFTASLLWREENGGHRARLLWEMPRSKNYVSSFALEGALTDEQIMLKAGSHLKARQGEYANWEAGVDLRPGRAGGTLRTRDTQASFQWSQGMLSAQSLYMMSGLQVDTSLLITDITAPGTGDYNTTQIRWDQKLHYRDETVDNSRLYTVHTTADDAGLHFDIADQDGWHATASFLPLREAADLNSLLGLTEPQEQPAPEAASEPSGGGSFIGGGPKK